MVQPMQRLSDHPEAIGRASNLQRLWESGGFALTVQLPPYLTADASEIVEQVMEFADLFDAILAIDAPDGAVALSSLAMAVLLKRRGAETIVHFSGRDRNRLALQSDILSLGVLGIPDLLIDMRPIIRASLEQNADARLVIDLDGPALLATAIKLRDEARFLSGASVKVPPALYVGALLALEEQILNEEEEALSNMSSAQFVVTTPVYDALGFTATLAAFQNAHPDFLQTRPLLVSLPLIAKTPVESSTNPDQADIQKIVSSIEILKKIDGIRGFNIVISQQSDLASLEQIVLSATSHSVERE